MGAKGWVEIGHHVRALPLGSLLAKAEWPRPSLLFLFTRYGVLPRAKAEVVPYPDGNVLARAR